MEDGDLRPYLDAAQRFIEPVAVAIESPEGAASLLEELGYISDKQVNAFTELGGGVDMIVDAITALADAVEADDEDAALVGLGELLLGIGRVFVVVNDFATKIQANFAGSDLVTDTDILTEIPRRLADYLVVKMLEDHYPMVFASLMLLGAIEVEQVDDTPTSFHAPYLKRVVNWEQIPDQLGDPVKAISDTLSDGDEFAYELLLYLAREFAVALGLPVTYDVPKEGPLAAFNTGDVTQLEGFDEITTLRFLLVSDPAAELGIELYPRIDTATGKRTGLGAGLRLGSDVEIPLSDRFKLVLKIAVSLEDSLGVTFEKGAPPQFVNKLFTSTPEQIAESLQFGVSASLVAAGGAVPDGKILSLALPMGRLQIGSGDLTVGVEKQAAFRIFVETDLVGGVLEFGTGSADGFITSIVPGDGIRSEFSLGIGVSSNAGLYFKGTSGLSIRVPLHLSLGPIGIDYVTIGAEFKDKEVPVFIATGLSANVGPLAAVVEDIGIKATVKPHADRSGNAGPLGVEFGFKPPKGVGLRIDAGVVRGGGYIFFDPDNGEYAGVLELTIANYLSLKAIGLITTKMPDGSNGFSLLVIITAEFGAGIQLGYGFTLIGVGGLLGLNRTMKLQPLMEGVRTGAINGIMFPVDPVANAPRIISDLKTIFPPQQNVFLIGPMAKLGWGGKIISLSLGIIIEIPGNVAILGVLALILPDPQERVLALQVNFAGAIEFDKKRVYFFAALYDSRLLTFTLEGEMAVLAAFGDQPNFVLSVGGFHPTFSPPPLPVPTPKRLSLTILNEAQAKLRAETYFAVTTNTVQLGVKAEAFFGFNSFSIEGNLAFDALFIFSPFHFVAEFSASFSAKVGGVGVFSVRSHFKLEGPTPWRAHGTGSISLLFFDIDVGFDKTWGEAQATTLPPIAVMLLLQQELDKAANWRALVPPANNLLVSLRQLDPAATELVLHPLGALRISQRAVPLDLRIDKVGTQRPSDANRFSLSVAAGPLAKQADVDESFAPAQFRDFGDTEKLTKPAFEPAHGGLDLSAAGSQLATGTGIKRVVRYELTTIDTYYRRFTHPFKRFPGGLWDHLLDGAAIARSPHSQFEQKRRNPFDDKVIAGDETYVVAFQSDNRAYADDQSTFTNEGMARDYLDQTIGDDPSLAGELHVIPEFEAATT